MPRRVNVPGADELFGPASGEDSEDSASSGRDSGFDSGASGRIRHNEKMTVYLTSAELMAVEHARLQLRSELGRTIDRGRLVRAALATALADYDDHGADSAIAQQLNEQQPGQ